MVPFILSSGLTGAGLSGAWIWQIGLAAIIVAAVALWLGSYFSAREQAEDPNDEKMWRLYNHIGLSTETQDLIRKEMAADEVRWQQKMAEEYELADAQQAMTGTGWQIAVAYVLSGVLALLPFTILPHSLTALFWSAGITALGLLLLSVLRSRLLGLPVAAGILRYFSLAGCGALCAYFVGSILA